MRRAAVCMGSSGRGGEVVLKVSLDHRFFMPVSVRW